MYEAELYVEKNYCPKFLYRAKYISNQEVIKDIFIVLRNI